MKCVLGIRWATRENYSFPELDGGALCVRLFLLSFSITLAKFAVFFFADDLGVAFWARTRIVGVATSSMKSNSRFLLDLKFKETDVVVEDVRNCWLFLIKYRNRDLMHLRIGCGVLDDFVIGCTEWRRQSSSRAFPIQFQQFSGFQSLIHFVQFIGRRLQLFVWTQTWYAPVVRAVLHWVHFTPDEFVYLFIHKIFSIFDLWVCCLFCVLLLWRWRSVKADSSRSLTADAIYRSSIKFHILGATSVDRDI